MCSLLEQTVQLDKSISSHSFSTCITWEYLKQLSVARLGLQLSAVLHSLFEFRELRCRHLADMSDLLTVYGLVGGKASPSNVDVLE